MLAIPLMFCCSGSLEGAIDPTVERSVSEDRLHSLSRSPSPLPVLHYPHTTLQRVLSPGAVFAAVSASPSNVVTMSGWFHIIWNGVPHYGLVDDGGKWTELLIEERVLSDAGGPRTLNRRRVQITGHRVETGAEAVRVLTINPEERDAQ